MGAEIGQSALNLIPFSFHLITLKSFSDSGVS